MGDEGYVRIGIVEVYQSLQRVVEGNQRLEAKVDTALSNQTLRLEQTIKELSRLEAHLENQKKDFEAELEEYGRRLDLVDRRPVVTPKMVTTAVTVMGVVSTVAMGIIGLIIKGG